MILLRSFSRAVRQFDDPAFRRVILLGLAGAAVMLAGLVIVAIWTIGALTDTGMSWLDALLAVFGGLAGFLLACIMFPAVAGLIVGLLIDDIADAVERRHYPYLPPAENLGYLTPMLMALRFLVVIVVVNLIGLILIYAIPGVNLIVFVVINGYLLGREFFDMVAVRRLPEIEVAALRRRHGTLVFMTGAGIALLFSIPIVNILAPIIGGAAMVHVFQMLHVRD